MIIVISYIKSGKKKSFKFEYTLWCAALSGKSLLKIREKFFAFRHTFNVSIYVYIKDRHRVLLFGTLIFRSILFLTLSFAAAATPPPPLGLHGCRSILFYDRRRPSVIGLGPITAPLYIISETWPALYV